MAHGSFYWNELQTNDLEGAKAFYAATIGWTFTEMPMPGGTYWLAQWQDRPMAGLVVSQAQAGGAPPRWVGYLAVDDVDARVAFVEPAGGTIVRPPFLVPGIGRIAVIADPEGAHIGWITPQPPVSPAAA